MKILGVSGSPIENSNTDQALKAVLEATGHTYEIVKLNDYQIEPCRACLGCVNTNECVIRDGGNLLAEKAKNADALVIAGFTPYSTLDARSKAFMERLYALRHKNGLMAGKPGAAVVTTAVPKDNPMLPPAGELAINAIHYYMMEEGMNFVGGIQVSGNVPCMKCGNGDSCKMSGVKMMYGSDACVAEVDINSFATNEAARADAEQLGKTLAEALTH